VIDPGAGVTLSGARAGQLTDARRCPTQKVAMRDGYRQFGRHLNALVLQNKTEATSLWLNPSRVFGRTSSFQLKTVFDF
jgi:hypothetical protein